MKTKLIILVLILSISASYAQQDAQFTQYMYNTININPAYAGSRDVMSVFALHRTQWVGLDGAPTTNTVSINTPVTGSNVGLGLSIINDKIGPSDENNIAIDFSYTIYTSDTYKLAFGLKASANLLNIDFSKLNQHDKNDYVFDINVDNKFSPNIGAGFYLYSDKGYFGLSAPNLLETTHFDKYASTGANSHVAKERIHYYFIAGHVFDLSDSVQFKPSILAKMVQGAPLQVDISGNFLINEKFTAGLAYRWSAAMSALVGFQVSETLFIGYGYDLETTILAHMKYSCVMNCLINMKG
jgi:type IX secretion system PorP/SprF family membrane protein